MSQKEELQKALGDKEQWTPKQKVKAPEFHKDHENGYQFSIEKTTWRFESMNDGALPSIDLTYEARRNLWTLTSFGGDYFADEVYEEALEIIDRLHENAKALPLVKKLMKQVHLQDLMKKVGEDADKKTDEEIAALGKQMAKAIGEEEKAPENVIPLK